MNIIDKNIQRLNKFQQSHHAPAFIYAVIKKSGDDHGGQQAALLTYYGFLALFPLLLLVTTISKTLLGNNPDLEQTVIKGTTDYFPLLGNQLSDHIHGLSKTGPALVFSILFILYGARGVADSFRRSVRRIWLVPKSQKEDFWHSLLKSILIILVGGLGFIFAAIVTAAASSAGKGIEFRALSILINVFLLFWLFTFLIKFSLPRHMGYKHIEVGAIAAAVGLVAMQYFGVFILGRQLKNLDALYSYFALALGLMFWIYLQAQIIFFSAQIAVVSDRKLWPRSLDDKHPTAADKQLKDHHNNDLA